MQRSIRTINIKTIAFNKYLKLL